jgi:protein TonB
MYPPDARKEGVGGVVLVDVQVGADGTVRDAKVIGEPDERLASAAIAGVRQIRYDPARKDGVAVTSRITARVEFR